MPVASALESVPRGERLGWTREALAFHSGLSWSAIAQVESGRRTNLRPSTLAALSRPLGVSIDYLVDGGQLASDDARPFGVPLPTRTISSGRPWGPFLPKGSSAPKPCSR